MEWTQEYYVNSTLSGRFDIALYSNLYKRQKYRILDNKTGEFAEWDLDVLQEQLKDLDFEGFDFGFAKYDVSDINIDGFFAEAERQKEKEPKKIQCPHCGEWFEE